MVKRCLVDVYIQHEANLVDVYIQIDKRCAVHLYLKKKNKCTALHQ